MTEKLHALIDPQGSMVRVESNIDPTVGTKRGYKWLLLVDTKPDFDPATQVREGPIVTILSDRVTRVWTVRDKNAQEIAKEEEDNIGTKLAKVGDVTFKYLANLENRVRALEGRQPATSADVESQMRALLSDDKAPSKPQRP